MIDDMAGHAPNVEAAPAEQPLLTESCEQERIRYQRGGRGYKDVVFLVLFLAAIGATVALGIYGALHRNRHFLDLIDKDSLNNLANCPYHASAEPLFLSHERSDEASIGALAGAFLTPVVVTLAVSIVLGFLLLWLLKAVPYFLVYATVSLVVLSPALGGLAAYALLQNERRRDPQTLLYPLGATAVLAAVFVYIRDKLALTARLLCCAAAALRENLSLLTFVAVTQLVAALLWIPIPLLVAVSFTDGHLVRNPYLKPGQACGAGYDVTCCSWQPRSWFRAYAALAGVAALWLASLLAHIQKFTVAGVIAQWYFAELGSQQNSSPITKNLGYALGPSLGTLCFSSLVATLVSIVRDMLAKAKEKMREGGTENVIISCAVYCFEALLSGIEFVTNFTLVTVAITGDSFCGAAQRTFALLRRNLLSSVTVDSVSVWVLNLGTFVLSGLWAAAVGLFCYQQWRHHSAPGFDREDAGILGVTEGTACFLVAFLLLRLFSQVLFGVIDTVYICYALDKDQGGVTKQQVHEIYGQLPSVQRGRREEEASVQPLQHGSRSNEPVIGYPASV